MEMNRVDVTIKEGRIYLLNHLNENPILSIEISRIDGDANKQNIIIYKHHLDGSTTKAKRYLGDLDVTDMPWNYGYTIKDG